MTDTMDQGVHFNKRIPKLNAGASSLVAFSRKLQIRDPKTLNTLYTSLVSSQMFGSGFLFLNFDELDVTKRAFVRRTIGLPRGSNNNFIHCVFFDILEADWHLLDKASFYHRLVSSEPNTHHNLAFKFDTVRLAENRRHLGWVGKVKQLFRTLNEYIYFVSTSEFESFRMIISFLTGIFNWSCLRFPRRPVSFVPKFRSLQFIWLSVLAS
jgi:hypothetical protein